MKKNSFLCLMSLCLVIFSSCQTVNTYKAQDLNGKWTIVSVMDETITLENMPFLEFNWAEKRVHGNVGCNMMTAGFEPDAKNVAAIKLVAPVVTMRACIYGMEIEANIIQAINKIAQVKHGATPNQVHLIDIEGKKLLVLEKD
ncbi:MAG: META domain-containing protein [Tannerella sp.]|nr:META domain-containing protein [Tannerella sp.]